MTSSLVFVVQSPVSDPPASGEPGATWKQNLDGMIALVESAVRRQGPPQLILFPANAVTGVAAGLTAENVADRLPTVPCQEAMRLSELARSTGAYIVSGAQEYDPVTPGAWYQTAFVLDPAGDTILKYRQVTRPLGGELRAAASPIQDDAALAELFPVVDTPFGRIGVCIGVDALSPELVRALTFNGAEIICHLDDGRTPVGAQGAVNARRARQWESSALWLTAAPADAGTSEIIGMNVMPIAEAGGPGPTVLGGFVDIDVLRTYRGTPRATNFLLMLRTPLFRDGFARAAANGLPQPDPAQVVAPYGIVCMQGEMRHNHDISRRDEWVRENIDRTLEVLGWAGYTSKIAVFPEFWLQGYERHFGLDEFLQLSMTVDGWEMQMLKEAAAKYGIYLCGSMFEKDDDWPGRFFNTNFIIDPAGELALRYRKITCLNLGGGLADTTPGDIYSAYIERYGGPQSLFPVLDTPLGRIATMSSFEIHYPEQVRQLALAGAEVILHTTAEVQGFNRHAWQWARQARAFDNIVYVAAANNGGDIAEGTPRSLHHGHSQVIDYDGRQMGVLNGAGEGTFTAQVDIMGLRRRRAEQPNWFADQPWGLWERVYTENDGCPVDVFLEKPMREKSEGPAILRQNLDRLYEKGVFVRPPVQHAAPSKAF